ncbi:MAG: undecaprenyl-diphosphate phosphatase [Candidatus Dadabacteria bacterium]|nr:undecaprenyl-diphosphate phosphatase [Candidatus Dadabacteria bacterium]
MDFIQSIALGVIQGITEILPISSTAHLVLVPWFFSWYDPGLPHNVALHMGTLASILYYFRLEWAGIAREFFRGALEGSFASYPQGRLGTYIIAASVPGALVGLVLERWASGTLRQPIVIAGALALFGIVLFAADRLPGRVKSVGEIALVDSIVIGAFQAIAIVPGVSRSGIAITGGLLRRYKRDEAARFSFLISAPIVAGAGALEARHLDFSTALSPEFLSGVLASAVFGYLSIRFLLKYVQGRSYTVFVVYRLALAAVIISFYFARG